MCERELKTQQNCNILTPALLAITAFLSRSPELLNRGPGGPASLGAGFLYRIFSPTGLIPNWLNFLSTELYNRSTSTFFLWVSQIALIQPIHGQGYTLLFLDRMHLLFTLVHFLFWQPGRVVGQYTTRSPDGDNHFFNIVTGDLQKDSLGPYFFIICQNYVLWVSIDIMKENDISV